MQAVHPFLKAAHPGDGSLQASEAFSGHQHFVERFADLGDDACHALFTLGFAALFPLEGRISPSQPATGDVEALTEQERVLPLAGLDPVELLAGPFDAR